MENMERDYYLMEQLRLLTGFSERTLRAHLKTGILQGEKINGLWHFTPEQVESFLAHPAVRPTILTKHNAVIYDFLAERHQNDSTCVILDLPSCERKKTVEFFCKEINEGTFQSLRFCFDVVSKIPRIILAGCAEDVRKLLDLFERFRGE